MLSGQRGLEVHRAMRIAMISGMISALKEPYAGGTEVLTAQLAAALARRGHDVTVFAPEGSVVPGAHLVSLGVTEGTIAWPTSPERMDGSAMRDLLVREQAIFHRLFLGLRARAGDFDLAHNHSFSGIPLVLSRFLPLPLVTTLHVPPILLEQREALRALTEAGDPARLVAVSRALAADFASVTPVAAVILNGVQVPPAPEARPGGHLLFVGRMAAEKGADLAIAIARAAGARLRLVGRVEDRTFFDECIAPALDDRVAYLGNLSQDEVWVEMCDAAAMLFTPRWPEPCSLAVLESQARGTPAIAFAIGGLPEQIVDCVTGFLVPAGDLDAAAAAVSRIDAIDRSACRVHAQKNFSIDGMVDAYERLYRREVARWATRRDRRPA